MKGFCLIFLLAFMSAFYALTFPSCYAQPTIYGLHFYVTDSGHDMQCTASTGEYYGMGNMSSDVGLQITLAPYNTTHIKYNSSAAALYIFGIPVPEGSSNHTITISVSGASKFLQVGYNTTLNVTAYGPSGTLWLNATNSTHYTIYNTTSNYSIPKNTRFYTIYQTSNNPANGILYWPIYNSSNTTEIYSVNGHVAGYPYNTTALTDRYISSHTMLNGTIRILRSDFITNKISNATLTNTFRALLYYQTKLITPAIVYFPGSEAFPYYFNTTDYTTYLRNNTVAYVYDMDTYQWFTVPALSVTNLADIYTISTILAIGATPLNETPAPVIPLRSSCLESGGLWTVNYTWSSPKNNYVYYWNSSLLNNTYSYGSTFYYQVNVSQYPSANYTTEDGLICARNNQSSMFGLPAIRVMVNGTASTLPAGSEGAGYFMVFFFILAMAVSMLIPYALIFAVAFNDTMGILPFQAMMLASVVTFVISIIINGYESFSIKKLIFLAVIIIAILMQIFPLAGYGTSTLTTITSNLQVITTLANLNPVDFVSTGLSLIANVILFIFQLPAYAVDLMLMPISPISPVLYTVMTPFGDAVKLGAYAYLALVGWEAITNQFKDR